jgi:sugar transferase (PEP-CTERM system associated)
MISSKHRELILFAGDVILVCLALFLGVLLRVGYPIDLSQIHLIATLFFSFVFLNSFYVFNLYDFGTFGAGTRVLYRLIIAAAIASLLCSAFFYFSTRYRYGRGVFALAALLVIPLSYAWRKLNNHYWAQHVSAVSTLVIGTGPSAASIGSLLQRSNSQYTLAGFLRTEGLAEDPAVPSDQILGSTSALERIIGAHHVGCVVVASDAQSLAPPEAELLTRTKLKGIRIEDAAGFYVSVTEALSVELLRHSWLWFAGGFDLVHAQLVRRIKRASDLVLASVFLVLSLPVAILAAIAIKLDSPGPIFYRQQRVGRDERVFELLKFRSMITNAESGGSPQWAKVNDARVTRIGRLLRTLRVDEIPQVINVLKGDMSFIGPRPERPEFVQQLKQVIPFYHLRHYVLPGVTGWAQVNYPYGASVEDAKRKLEYDLYYILDASPLLDLRIILRTIRVLMFRTGSR